MEMTKVEAQALIVCCLIYLNSHDSDVVEHLLYRLGKRVGVSLP